MTKQLEKKITKLVTMKKKKKNSKEQKMLMDMKVYKFYTLKTLFKATSSSETKPNSRQSK